MPALLPFRALRPSKEVIGKFTAKSSDFRTTDEIVAEMKAHPDNYYYITKHHLLEESSKPPEHFFPLSAKYIQEKEKAGILLRDKVPSYYVYRQIDHDTARNYTGIIGLVDVIDIENNVVKKHELTKVVREEYLYKHLHETGILGEPVLIGHQHSPIIDELISTAMAKEPEYDFRTIDHKEHVLWLINTSEDLEKMAEEFMNMPAFYIADGHHRCASAVRNYHRNKNAANRFMMVYILDENQFHIDSFHRLLSEVPKDDLLDLNKKLEANFDVENYVEGELYKPLKHSEFGLLTRDFSLKLTLKKQPHTSNPEAQLDVSILESKFFKPILDINHPRTDHRLSYISSQEPFSDIKRLLDNREIDIIVSNFPISFEEVKKVADANKTMPPKSTYIEPKLRGGMVIQKF